MESHGASCGDLSVTMEYHGDLGADLWSAGAENWYCEVWKFGSFHGVPRRAQ